MKKTLVYLFSFLLLFLFSCKKEQSGKQIEQQTLETEVELEETSDSTTDWDGEYKGIFPCGDCDGIEISLTLNFDNTFVQTDYYIGKGGPYESRGDFVFDEEKHEFTLLYEDGSLAKYRLDKYSISLLDQNDDEMEEYRLEK